MLTSATEQTIQLCFGLLSTDKYPKTTIVSEVESTVKHIAEYGTYVSSDTLVYDSYEKINCQDKLRAYIDFDVKRYKDGNEIPKYEGIILREQLREKFATILPHLEGKYGTIVFGDSSGMKTPIGQYTVSFRLWFPCVVGSRKAIQTFAETIVNETVPKFCKEHKKEGMINVNNSRCKTPLCFTQVNNQKYKGYCLYCYIHIFPDEPLTFNYKTKEKNCY
jgi:hypothetical protein